MLLYIIITSKTKNDEQNKKADDFHKAKDDQTENEDDGAGNSNTATPRDCIDTGTIQQQAYNVHLYGITNSELTTIHPFIIDFNQSFIRTCHNDTKMLN